jgi:hypothetical protein
VDEWLKGSGEPDVIAIVYVPRWHPRDSEPLPLFDVHDRGLLCLRKMPAHLPYASYVPAKSYQLCLGEKGMCKFLVTVYDDQGHAYTRDDTASVSETIAAMRWYLALPRDDTERRCEDLFDALHERNPQIVYHSIRELAETSAPYAAETFKKMLTAAAGRLRVEIMLGLWIIGQREVSLQILDQEFRDGKDAWLARWGLRSSLSETGEPTGTLFGPAALSVPASRIGDD